MFARQSTLSGLLKARLRGIWTYRGFVLGSVKREFQSRYRNSLLGAAWTVINPLAMILVYTVIFSQIMRAKLPGVDHNFAYSIYLCSGLLTWGLFAEIVGRGQSMFLDNANLIKKINFPKISLPIIVLFNSTLNFSIIFALFLIFITAIGAWPGLVFFAAIPVLIVQMIFAVGLGMVIGILNVFFRDVGQFFGIVLQFWFWLTPIVYTPSILPERIKAILLLNPMYPIISSYQEIFVFQAQPTWLELLYPLVLGVALCLLGLRLFRQHGSEMVDEL